MRYGKVIDGVIVENPIERIELKVDKYRICNPKGDMSEYGYYQADDDAIPSFDSKFQNIVFGLWVFNGSKFSREVSAEYKPIAEIREIKDLEIANKCVVKIDAVLSPYNREYAQARMSFYLNLIQQGIELDIIQQADKASIESAFQIIAGIRQESDNIRAAIKTETNIETIISMDFAE